MATKREVAAREAGKAIAPKLGGSALRQKLIQDDIYVQYKRIVKNIKTQIDVDALSEECKQLHLGRASRNLTGTTPGANKILEAAVQDAAYRARFTKIKIDLYEKIGILEVTLSGLRSHLQIEYSSLSQAYSTKEERRQALDRHIKQGVILKSSLSTFHDIVDFYIVDIDKAAYSLSLAFKCIELVSAVKSRNL